MERRTVFYGDLYDEDGWIKVERRRRVQPQEDGVCCPPFSHNVNKFVDDSVNSEQGISDTWDSQDEEEEDDDFKFGSGHDCVSSNNDVRVPESSFCGENIEKINSSQNNHEGQINEVQEASPEDENVDTHENNNDGDGAQFVPDNPPGLVPSLAGPVITNGPALNDGPPNASKLPDLNGPFSLSDSSLRTRSGNRNLSKRALSVKFKDIVRASNHNKRKDKNNLVPDQKQISSTRSNQESLSNGSFTTRKKAFND
ncbi:hypothetical protein L2E82_30377 [Cichorium intybus]|uniref:Uncharacterized protein n=1 Tax=Cichorium intybus TaxID=13427 RepID=A0ACB9D0J0_CICIN|nr:hypothetical protein L2E82_30377 [Cichorium intybus]